MNHRSARRLAAALLLALAGTLAAPRAHAQASDGVTQKLIQILVKNGVLTQSQANGLL
jgi:hypothetical protein